MKKLASLLNDFRAGWSLEQEFFTSPEVYASDIEHIWKKQWLFVGFATQIPKTGDYFVYNMMNESVIIIRGKEGKIYGHHNTCRHRGSAICTEETGNCKKLICPYHCWVYGINGELQAARLMPAEFNKKQFNLHSVKLEVLEGLIFISFSDCPESFQPIANDLGPFLKPFQLDRAKIVQTDRHRVRGNWKLIAQNFRECYHCGPAHPEYCKAVVGANYRENDEKELLLKDSKKDWKRKGLPTETVDFVVDSSHFATRYPLRDGVQSYSLDGNPVSIPMGTHEDYNTGVVGLSTLPNFWMDGVSDYIWCMLISPVDANHCDVKIFFLADENAREGIDYHIENLASFWRITGDQDMTLITNNQRGIETGKYSSGPYSEVEEEVTMFDEWYISKLRKGDIKGAGH